MRSTAGGSATPSPAASASHRAAAKPRKTQAAGVGHHVRQSPSTAATALAGTAGKSRCAPAGIVLSLFTSQASYAQRELPKFSVYAVSTSATACTFTYGPGSVHVVVTRRGHVVWDSASCRAPAPRAVRFTLGVPEVLTMRWDRQATSPSGCGGSLSAGASGTLDAVAMTDGQSSTVHSFRLDR